MVRWNGISQFYCTFMAGYVSDTYPAGERSNRAFKNIPSDSGNGVCNHFDHVGGVGYVSDTYPSGVQNRVGHVGNETKHICFIFIHKCARINSVYVTIFVETLFNVYDATFGIPDTRSATCCNNAVWFVAKTY